MEPIRLFPIIVLLSWSPSSTAVGAAGVLHRARHAGAPSASDSSPRATRTPGVVLVLSLTYFIYLGWAGYSTGVTVDARRSQPTVNT